MIKNCLHPNVYGLEHPKLQLTTDVGRWGGRVVRHDDFGLRHCESGLFHFYHYNKNVHLAEPNMDLYVEVREGAWV